MTRHCPYCGEPVKDDDKFCISCGKPLISNIPSEDKINEKEKKKQKEEETKRDKEEKEEEKKEKKKNEKKADEEKKEEEEDLPELPEEIKQQVEYRLDLNRLKITKQKLGRKLEKIEKAMEGNKYDVDDEYAQKINSQLQAIKEISNDLKEKERSIESKIDKPFITEQLNFEIDTKKDQLKSIVRDYKLKKLKKFAMKDLKKQYKKELKDLRKKKENIITNIEKWLAEISMKKTKLKKELEYEKAKFSAKEISEEEYERSKKDFKKDMKLVELNIETLKDLTSK
ncbi:MAG: zinc ribbon domain-containing protein [Promethearchaeia archaeon]